MRRPPAILRTFALSAALLFCAAAAFGQTATTDPVGFITVKVDAGSVESPRLSLVSPTLLQPVVWQGAISDISGTTITVPNAPWSGGQFGTNGQYFVEVASGANAGAWTDVESNTNTALTSLDDLSAFASAGSVIRIRKHTKLTDFLGVNNSAGLLGGNTLEEADEVLVYDGATPVIYWYYNGTDLPKGWYDAGFVAAPNAVIAPHQGVAVKRKGSTAVNFISSGSVKKGNTFFPVQPGVNVVGTVSASGLTLATSGLVTGVSNTGFQGATTAELSDEVTLFTATGPVNYWYYNGVDLPAGWYDLGYGAAGAVSIPPGTAVVLNRKAPGVNFNWVLPSPTTF